MEPRWCMFVYIVGEKANIVHNSPGWRWMFAVLWQKSDIKQTVDSNHGFQLFGTELLCVCDTWLNQDQIDHMKTPY